MTLVPNFLGSLHRKKRKKKGSLLHDVHEYYCIVHMHTQPRLSVIKWIFMIIDQQSIAWRRKWIISWVLNDFVHTFIFKNIFFKYQNTFISAVFFYHLKNRIFWFFSLQKHSFPHVKNFTWIFDVLLNFKMCVHSLL